MLKNDIMYTIYILYVLLSLFSIYIENILYSIYINLYIQIFTYETSIFEYIKFEFGCQFRYAHYKWRFYKLSYYLFVVIFIATFIILYSISCSNFMIYR